MASYKFDGVEAHVRRLGPFVYVSFRKVTPRGVEGSYPWIEAARLDKEPGMGEVQAALRNFEFPEDYDVELP